MVSKKRILSSLLLGALALGAHAEETAKVLSQEESQEESAKTQASQTILGLELFTGESKINGKAADISLSETFDRTGVRFKFGAKKVSGARFEGYLELEDYDAFDNGVVGVGGNIRYAFGDDDAFRPFWKIGAAIGSTELEDDVFVQYEDESLGYFALVAGLGLEKKISEKADFLIGLDIGKRYWQDIEFRDSFFNRVTVEQDDTPVSIYIGLNFGI